MNYLGNKKILNNYKVELSWFLLRIKDCWQLVGVYLAILAISWRINAVNLERIWWIKVGYSLRNKTAPRLKIALT